VVWVLLHDTSRSGVPIVLERMLRALGRPEHVHVVAIHGGPLRGRLGAAATSCTVLEPEGRRSIGNAMSVGVRELGVPDVAEQMQHVAWRRRLRSVPTPDVVVVHGAGGWRLLGAVRGDPPYVVHLHELATGLDRSIDPVRQASLLGRASLVLAVSRPVADLAVRRGADPRRVELLPGVVEISALTPSAATPGSDAGRAVMGAGAPGWRKATDRVVSVAYELDRAGYVDAVGWVGGAPSGQDARWVRATDPVRWYDETDDPWVLMDAAEVILLPSREDPLPLVALEAGLHAKAVVATPTGGLPDLLDDGRGAVAPAHDVGWLARATGRLLGDPSEREALGCALREEVLARHDAAVVAPIWWGILRDAAG